jgi:uncharacterized membrane protein YfcA
MSQPLLIFLLCAGVGGFSAVLGIGGGVLLVPIFTLLLKLPIHQAVAMSLCCVMATSVTSATKYLSSGLVDLKAVLYLETTTIVGSYVAGRLAGSVSDHAIAIIFAIVLLISAVTMLLGRTEARTSANLKHAYPVAMGTSVFAGGLVGLLGIGGGIVKVPILQIILGKSIKEAVASSSMMIGISAAIAVIPYLNRGEVPTEWVPFATLGTVAGAFLGAKLLHKIESLYIKILFAAVLLYTAITMIVKATGD